MTAQKLSDRLDPWQRDEGNLEPKLFGGHPTLASAVRRPEETSWSP
jgi:hypothetical protein